MGLIKWLGISTAHEGQHQGGERGKHATSAKAGRHTKQAATKAPKQSGNKK